MAERIPLETLTHRKPHVVITISEILWFLSWNRFRVFRRWNMKRAYGYFHLVWQDVSRRLYNNDIRQQRSERARERRRERSEFRLLRLLRWLGYHLRTYKGVTPVHQRLFQQPPCLANLYYTTANVCQARPSPRWRPCLRAKTYVTGWLDLTTSVKCRDSNLWSPDLTRGSERRRGQGGMMYPGPRLWRGPWLLSNFSTSKKTKKQTVIKCWPPHW